MINYIVELAVIHAVLILAYMLVLRNANLYCYRRFYLIMSTIFAVVVPLLKLPVLIAPQVQITSQESFTGLPEAMVIEGTTVNSGISMLTILTMIYIVIALFFLVRSVGSLTYIFYLRYNSQLRLVQGVPVYVSAKIKGCFSFFNWIFISEDNIKTDDHLDYLFAHEKAHIQLGHTVDLLFFEIVRSLFWWLPTSWYVNQEIRHIHEYQADDYVIQSHDYYQYSSILMNTVLQSHGLILSSSFNNKSLYKRLKAMQQTKSTPSHKLYGFNLIVFALLFVSFACTEERPLVDAPPQDTVSEEELFSIVEQPPSYQGGMANFYDYIRKEVSYPKSARQRNVEGRVYVQFVIEKDGSISNVQTTRGIGSGIDEAVAKVIREAPMFQPGKQRGRIVRTKMIMHITFQLDENQNGIITVGEAKYNAGSLKVDATYDQGIWTGVIKDPEDNLLPGANIIVSGTSRGTVSDLDGTFKVEASASEALNVSYVGYNAVNLKAGTGDAK